MLNGTFRRILYFNHGRTLNSRVRNLASRANLISPDDSTKQKHALPKMALCKKKSTYENDVS
jgi:hypothetical protein